MGFARWKRLHRLAYAAGALGAIHFVWRVKKDIREPIVFVAILGVGLRVARLRRAAPSREDSGADRVPGANPPSHVPRANRDHASLPQAEGPGRCRPGPSHIQPEPERRGGRAFAPNPPRAPKDETTWRLPAALAASSSMVVVRDLGRSIA